MVSERATAAVMGTLLRDIEDMIEGGGGYKEIGEALRVQVRQMFHWWHRV